MPTCQGQLPRRNLSPCTASLNSPTMTAPTPYCSLKTLLLPRPINSETNLLGPLQLRQRETSQTGLGTTTTSSKAGRLAAASAQAPLCTPGANTIHTTITSSKTCRTTICRINSHYSNKVPAEEELTTTIRPRSSCTDNRGASAGRLQDLHRDKQTHRCSSRADSIRRNKARTDRRHHLSPVQVSEVPPDLGSSAADNRVHSRDTMTMLS